MNFDLIAQQIIFTALNGNLSCPVYDDAPDVPEGAPDDGFPYVVIGDDTARPWDTKGELGSNATVTLHIWSLAEGMAEAKGIAGEIYTLLHRAELLHADVSVVDCLNEFSQFMRDPDGVTRHGVVRYRLMLEKA